MKTLRADKQKRAGDEAMKTLRIDKQIRAGGATRRVLRFEKADISKGYLILVNPSHPLKRNLPSEHLVSVLPDTTHTLLEHRPFTSLGGRAAIDTTDILLERQTAKMLSKVMNILGCEREIVSVSGYRTMLEQQTIYADSLNENGEEFTKKYIAIPGCSEHQTGFAVDLAEYSELIDFIRPSFPYTGICGHFRDICVQYGFIERYPAGREHLTSIAHEPWHFRYVGYPHSEVMKRSDLTLEEYTDYLKQFLYHRSHLRLEINWHDYEIFYVPIKNESERERENEDQIENTETIIEIPNDIPFQVSGNNVDGVVVTLWRD